MAKVIILKMEMDMEVIPPLKHVLLHSLSLRLLSPFSSLA
jgi:hypothetical protein